MTTPDPQSEAMLTWLAEHPTRTNDPNATPRFPDDEDTLRRSFGGLSKRARSIQRRPLRLVVDELGFDQRGGYHAECDGVLDGGAA
ncbi:hypothetical protein [Nocardioides sp. URHA0032]|uniref:hypothetical protein n=1 Tax=Nocardioides sp. URHA0032 TaxID=1380388 RepID=UPI00048DBBCF|nr:hypothetical protein [Nocardioides sp. URHA0032]